MDVRVAGHQVDTGDALRSHVSSRIGAITDKYFSRAVAANVTFGRGPHESFTCDIVAPVSQGIVLKASDHANDAHIAFEGAATKIERQLSRYVSRLRDHKQEGASDYVANAAYTVFAAPSEPADGPRNPAIVAETRVDIPESSVSDAVMLMDLRNTSALMFKNSISGDYNMVYRRDDGTIGWVEPQTS